MKTSTHLPQKLKKPKKFLYNSLIDKINCLQPPHEKSTPPPGRKIPPPLSLATFFKILNPNKIMKTFTHPPPKD